MALDTMVVLCTGLIIVQAPDPTIFFFENEMWKWPDNYIQSTEIECEKGTFFDWDFVDLENLIVFCRKKDGAKQGVWKKLYLNGKVQVERYYKNNVVDGIEKQFFENGALYEKGMVVEGESDGDWVFYYENGVVRMQGTFNLGCKIGIWVVYDETGNLIMDSRYKDCKSTGISVYQ